MYGNNSFTIDVMSRSNLTITHTRRRRRRRRRRRSATAAVSLTNSLQSVLSGIQNKNFGDVQQ
jgi:hypothetical protein